MKRSLALLAVAVLAGCQDYQFVPVGRCLLQPGSASVGSPSAVDILFVLDDSYSMYRIQTDLANNLERFIERLAQKQQERVAASKVPFDLFVAVTTTGVVVNRYQLDSGTAGECTAATCNVSNPTLGGAAYHYSCSGTGHCADIVKRYYNFAARAGEAAPRCTPGVLRANGDPYPAGSFVAAGSNAKMLSFTKDLKWASAATDPTIQALIGQFKANVEVGDCGANQEMPFEAARLAIQKGQKNEQGNVTWPHDNSKLAVIFVSNEDDCSTSPADTAVEGASDPNQRGLVWDGASPGKDSCDQDAQRDTPVGLYPLSRYVDFFSSLGRPVSLAFVRPGVIGAAGSANPCAADEDAKNSLGTRTRKLAELLSRQPGINTVEASVCGNFADTLSQIADQMPPPDHIVLPTIPAEARIVQLRIVDSDGNTVRTCAGPPSGREWIFVDCASDQEISSGTSKCVKLAPTSPCAPQPGEKLQAEYLGRVPQEGCRSQADCTRTLGGRDTDWTCNSQGSCECAGKSGP